MGTSVSFNVTEWRIHANTALGSWDTAANKTDKNICLSLHLYSSGVDNKEVKYRFETYTNTKSLCCVTGTNTVVGHLYVKNKLIEKEIRFVVTRGKGEG